MADTRNTSQSDSPCECVLRTEFPVDESLERCVEIADYLIARAEEMYPRDEKLSRNLVTLRAHVAVLLEDLRLTEAGLV
jgi:hypothetical protein